VDNFKLQLFLVELSSLDIVQYRGVCVFSGACGVQFCSAAYFPRSRQHINRVSFRLLSDLFLFFYLLFFSYQLRLLQLHTTDDTSNATAPREKQDDDYDGRTMANDEESSPRNVVDVSWAIICFF
jgi:hypothetical protein